MFGVVFDVFRLRIGADTEVGAAAKLVLGSVVFLGWWPSGGGVADPGFLAAHWDSGFRMDAQWSGHGGPPPRDPGAGPLRGVFSVAGTLGLPIEVSGLPIGRILFRSKSSGADTEVRPPATLVLCPCGGGSRLRAHGGYRSMFFGCPLGLGFSDVCPAERTQRSAPPPPCSWTLGASVCGWGSSGDRTQPLI